MDSSTLVSPFEAKAATPTRGRTATLVGLVLPVALTLLGFALRLNEIDACGLWFDEAHSVHMALLPLPQLVAEVSQDIHPPLFFALLGGWMQLAGGGEFALRYFSLATGLLAVPLTYVLGRSIGGPRVGAVSATVVAISPLLVYYAHEVRMYAGSVSLLTAIGVFVWRAARREAPRRWVLPYGLLVAAAGYTHLYNLLAVIALNVALVVAFAAPLVAGSGQERVAVLRTAKWWLAGNALAALLLAPWVPIVLGKGMVGGTAPNWQPLDFGPTALAVGKALTQGASAAPGSQHPLAWGVWVVAALGLAVALAALVRRGPRPGAAWGALLGALWLVVCIGGVYLSLAGRSEFGARYMLSAYPGFALLVGSSFALLFRWRWLLVAATGLLCLGLALPLAEYYRDPQITRPDDRAAIRAFERRAGDGDVAVFDAQYSQVVYDYYNQRGLPATGLPNANNAGKKASIPGVRPETEQALAALAARHDRIWLFLWQDHFTDPDRIVEKWLDNHLVRFHQSAYNGWIRLWGYESRPAGEMTFDDLARLAAYDVSPSTTTAGQVVTVKLTWQAVRAPKVDYQVFVHLVDDKGNLVAQHDGPPAGGKSLTSNWQKGLWVEDAHALQLAPEVPPGTYYLRAGFYSLGDMQRLRTASADFVPVGEVQVRGK